jgi:alpha-amylase
MNNKVIIGLSCMNFVDEHDESNEKLYLKVIKPFVRELYKNPEIKAVLHFSGVLLDWLEDKHPEIIMLISELIKKKKQLELLGSGYYEPILTMISPTDRTGQIESLTTLIRKKFGKRPRGCWIAGNYWDNSLINPVKSSGMDYVFLDYEKMMIAGIDTDDKYSACVTEENGKLLNVFPIHRDIIRSTLNKNPDELVSIINNSSEKEKLYSIIFREYDFENRDENWIEDFFKKIAEAKNIKTISPFYYIKNNGRFKKAYFHNNNFFKKILAESPETNLLYAKMIHIQTLVNQIRGDKYKKKSAQESLWAGQNYNLFNIVNRDDSALSDRIKLRKKAYKYLIEAELNTRQQGVFIPSLIKTDFDLDGVEEYMYQGEEYNLYLHIDGGSVFEFDRFKNKWNYADSIYCENGKTGICRSFHDRIYDNILGDEELDNPEKNNKSLDLGKMEYSIDNYDRENKIIRFIKRIKNGDKDIYIKLTKQYRFLKKKIEIIYEISNIGTKVISRSFSTTANLSLIEDNKEKENYKIDSNDIVIRDLQSKLILNSTVPYRCDIRENKVNCSYNFNSFEMIWDLEELAPGKTFTTKIELKI